MKKKLKRQELVEKAIVLVLSCRPEDFSFFNVNWLARASGVSVPNLSRAFKLEHRRTLQQYIRLIKVETMRSLMESNPEMTMKEIAEIIDYSSGKYAGKIFTQHTGLNPKACRIAFKKKNKKNTF